MINDSKDIDTNKDKAKNTDKNNDKDIENDDESAERNRILFSVFTETIKFMSQRWNMVRLFFVLFSLCCWHVYTKTRKKTQKSPSSNTCHSMTFIIICDVFCLAMKGNHGSVKKIVQIAREMNRTPYLDAESVKKQFINLLITHTKMTSHDLREMMHKTRTDSITVINNYFVCVCVFFYVVCLVRPCLLTFFQKLAQTHSKHFKFNKV